MSEDLSKLTLVELLDRLDPIPEPPPVSFWPQTEGWIWVGFFLIACVAWLIHRWLHNRRANAYRRAALKEIAAAGDDPAVLAKILRCAALAAFPRTEVASLYGEAWLAFLDRAYRGTGFSEGPGRVLAVAPYAPSSAATNLTTLVAEWVRRHRRTGGSGP